MVFLLESFAIPLCAATPRAWSPPEGSPSRRGAISKKVFVGNLSFDVTREELVEAFNEAGRVLDAKVPTDRETGRPRGFAFVEFEDEDAVQRCIQQMNGRDLKGRPLRVNEAEDRPPRPAGFGPSRGPGMGARGSGPGFPRPSPGHVRSVPPLEYPPDFERDDRGGGRSKRFRQKPANRRSSRRRRDQVADDDDY
jgi:RNA recognition motif-containing protein